MSEAALNPRQRRWLRAYLGRDDRYHGNATQCYKLVYETDNTKVAGVCASKMMRHPIIQSSIKAWTAAQQAQTVADANFVLKQSVRLYDRAMGDAPVEVDVIDTVTNKDGSTSHVARTVETREYNPAIARQTLELIGRHTSVQAFQDNVEHKHTHRLEQALARRGKQVEAAAEARVIEHAPQDLTTPAPAEADQPVEVDQ
jgi:hypothetical protein